MRTVLSASLLALSIVFTTAAASADTECTLLCGSDGDGSVIFRAPDIIQRLKEDVDELDLLVAFQFYSFNQRREWVAGVSLRTVVEETLPNYDQYEVLEISHMVQTGGGVPSAYFRLVYIENDKINPPEELTE
ncbi:MAG: hypothetical protein WDZ93_00365 [Candidatus Paceibacterota bacterium]